MSATSDSSRAVDDFSPERLLAIAQELSDAAKRETSRADFFGTWLNGVVVASLAECGELIETSSTPPRVIATSGTNGAHECSAESAALRAEARRSATERRQFVWFRDEPANSYSTEATLDQVTLIAPLPTTANFSGVLELMMPADVSPARQRTCIQFVAQALAFVDDFLLREQVRTLSLKQSLFDESLDFIRSIQANSDGRLTAYAIANEGRRFVGCDRVTVFLRRGRRYRIVAISGQGTFDVRAPELKLLVALTERVAAAGQPLHSDEPSDAVPPPLQLALADYVDESHAKFVAVVPLQSPPKQTGGVTERVAGFARPLLGALVFESHTQVETPAETRTKIRFVVEYATPALENAVAQDRIFLLPLWRALGNARETLRARSTRFKTLASVAAIGAAIAALTFIQADFALHASATFQPVERRNVFAPLDGTVSALAVNHGDRVAAGALLLELRNTDLEVALSEVRGERTAAVEQWSSVERSLFGEEQRLTAEERVRLSGQRAELKRRIESLDEKIHLLEGKKSGLKITSPIDGEVITWNIERLLRNRPVQQGQSLLTIADTTHAWELEVYLPEHYVGHLSRARRQSTAPLEVRFRPTSDPSHEFVGVVKEIDEISEVRGDRGNTVLVTVAVDPTELPQLKPGVEATAKVMCGRRSLGYVWFHDLVDFVQAKILFRLF